VVDKEQAMRQTDKPKKPKKGFLDGYKTYDPKKEGYGNPDQWTSAFRWRMGLDEANRVVGSGDPWQILGVQRTATWDEVKKAYRKLAMQHHPDRGGNKADFIRVQAAYELLEAKYKV
jgi:DnaJ-class molecular chaperone